VLGPFVVGIVLGVLGGVFAGTFFGGESEALRSLDPFTRSAKAKEREPVAEPPASESSSPRPVEIARTEGETTDSTAPVDVVDRVAAAASAAPPPATRRGTRSLRGKVLGRDGQPLADVVVRATRQSDSDRTPGRSRSGDSAPPLDSLDEVVKTAVRNFYDRQSDVREARTASDGTYSFADLREGRFSVQAWRVGFDLATVGDSIVRPDATVDFTAVPVVGVDLVVLMPDGSRADKALIQAKRAGEKNARRNDGWASDQTRLSFPIGDWELKATLGDPDLGPSWPDYIASDPQPIALAEGASPPAVTLRLKGSPGIRGEVRQLGGVGRKQQLVKLEVLATGATPDLKELAQNRAAQNVWARDGRYTFKDLVPGRYVVGVSRSWNEKIAASAVVEVRDSMVVQDLEIAALDPAHCVVARVLDPDGRLVDEASFTLMVQSSDGNSWSNNAEAERKADGTFLVPLENGQDEGTDLVTSWPAGGSVKLSVHCERFGDKSVDLAPSTRTVEIRFGSPSTLLATIQGYAGSGYEGRLSLTLVRAEQREQQRWYGFDREQLGADGTKKFGPIEAGRYRLRLMSQANGRNPWGQSQLADVEVILAPGENRASIAIPALYTLTIETSGGGGQLQLHPARDGDGDEYGGGWRMAQVDDKGRAVFEDLPAGDYTVQHWGGGEDDGAMRVQVPTSGVVRFTPMAPNALYVNIEDSKGALARAGFQAGDYVVAVGGKEYTTAADLKAAMSAGLSQKELKLTVLRGSDRVDVTVEGKLFANPFEMGGNFQPISR
jgi:hypothetical protein